MTATQQRGVRVKDDATGDVVATRTVNLPDEEGNSRVVELMELVGRPLSVRTIRSLISSPDPANLWNVGNEFYQNLIPAVGDQGGTLVVFPEFGVSGGSVSVTPVFYDPTYSNRDTNISELQPNNDADGYIDANTDVLVDTGSYVLLGRLTGGVYEGFLSYEIDYPRYSRINSAYVRWFRQSGGTSLDQDLAIYIANGVNLDLPINRNSMDQMDWIGPINWDASGWLQSDYINSQDFSSILQQVVNRDDFHYGDRVLLRFGGQTAGADQWVRGSSYQTVNPSINMSIDWMGWDGFTDVDVIGIGETKVSSMGSVLFTADSKYHAPFMAWDLFGSGLIGLHITAVTGPVTLKAGVI